MSKSTMVELVAELEKIPPVHPLLNHIIEEAKAGEFHDYKNKKYPCGKIAVVHLLKEVINDCTNYDVCQQLAVIRTAVIDGEYDEQADEEDKAEMKSWIQGTPGGEALATLLGL